MSQVRRMAEYKALAKRYDGLSSHSVGSGVGIRYVDATNQSRGGYPRRTG